MRKSEGELERKIKMEKNVEQGPTEWAKPGGREIWKH